MSPNSSIKDLVVQKLVVSLALVAQMLGKYQLVKKLAVGGMGEVWLARQKGPVGFEKLVVVKTLLQHLREDQEFVNMFFDEARIAAVLNHPNIAQIYDLGEDKGEYFIAMEYVHGLSLRDVVVYALEKNSPQVPRHRRRRRRARLRPPGEDAVGPAARSHSPRREPAEHPHRVQRRGEADRLRRGEGGQQARSHRHRHHQGQVRVHVAGAGLRPPARRAQ
jgi:hypothetical protein